MDRLRSDRAPAVKAVKHGREVGDIADLPTKCVGVDLLLDDAAHPLERCLPGLLTPVGLRGGADRPDRRRGKSAPYGFSK